MDVGDWDAFVSYDHGDADWVQVLAGNLERAGVSVFLDAWELIAGDRWIRKLEDGLRGSANGVLVVGPHSLSRPWVQEEYEVLLRQAVEQSGRRLIPVLYADVDLPPFLANRQWVDFRGSAATGPAYDKRLDELVRALRGQPAAERPAAGSARQWPTAPGGERFRAAGPMQATLRITSAGVTLTNGEAVATQQPGGLRLSTATAATELAWRRTHPRPGAEPGEEDVALASMGRALSTDFLAGPVGAALARLVDQAASLNEVLQLGVEVADEKLTDLAWETLVCPQASGDVPDVGGSALALHRNVALYRQVADPEVTPAYQVRGPLRLLVTIASPETGGGELLNYEAEMDLIVAAVEPARRRGQAYVRMLNEGSLAAIKAALSEDPEGFHVLHLSCHARPGELVLETADGEAELVSAQKLLSKGVPAGTDLPMIVLSGCSTGLSAREERLPAAQTAGRFKQEPEGEAVLASFAAELVQSGVPHVLAMQAPVTDRYATNLAAELYRHLATDTSPDPLLALADARRSAEQTRLALPHDSPQRGPAEWATPTLLARGLRLPLFDRQASFGKIRPLQTPVFAEGVVVRRVGDFIGRRSEARQARRALTGQKAGMVIHGIGGVGKSSLAAEVLRSLGDDAGLVISKAGPLLIDDLLDETGARIHQAASQSAEDDQQTNLGRAGLALRAANIEWSDRWRLLVEQLLPALPMTVLLDNFEDNLQHSDDGWTVRDPELADLLSRWITRPGQSHLIITSRHPFTLPGNAERRLDTLHLGPLSSAETGKLIWRLPGIDALSPTDKERAYRDVGGHPRALEYLDALLRGQARFDDIADRIEAKLRTRDIPDPAAWLATTDRDLDANLAETVTFAAGDILLPTLLQQLSATPLARELIIGASVYRVPVDDTALVFQVGEPAERPPDPARQDRIQRVAQAITDARERASSDQISLEEAGLSAEDFTQYEADVAEERSPPYGPPAGLQAAIRAAQASGLLTSVPGSDKAAHHVIHRWTASAIATLYPDAIAEAHRQAAAFWQWRVKYIPQSREQDVEQLLEARYHHLVAGQTAKAMIITEEMVVQLQTWGQYGRAIELCRETLMWFPTNSDEAVKTHGQLGILAENRSDYITAETHFWEALAISQQLDNQTGMAITYYHLGNLAQNRGDYTAAETLYRQALTISEQLDNQKGIAGSYHQLGILAQKRGDYAAAETLYHQSLTISERLGDQANVASSSHQFGNLAYIRGDYAAAEIHYHQSLTINERIGNQADMATSYHQLGRLAQLRGDYTTAETLYHQSLTINERIGNQAGMATSYHQLGRLAQLRGDYTTAETLYHQSLTINERIGNQAGMATSYSALADLSEALGDLGAAVVSQVAALAIRLGIEAPAGGNVRALSELRRSLGTESFLASLPPGMDEESIGNLIQILDDWDNDTTG